MNQIIGERGRIKFKIEPGYNYKFILESPYLSNAWTVEAYIWKVGDPPGSPVSCNPSNGNYSCSKYIGNYSGLLYTIHVYYYPKSSPNTQIYLDEIVFKV